MTEPEDNSRKPLAQELPPGFRSWRSIYAVVFACFIGYVVLLAIFTTVFA